MNIVESGGNFRIYGDAVKTYKQLPVGTYTVMFHPQEGYWLEVRNDLETQEEKIYGKHEKRIAKILRSYEASRRNFGVILSGKKGTGKSLLTRMLAAAAVQRGLPVIIVDAPIPGLASFIEGIPQEVVIIFDEFEKIFKYDEENNTDNQSALLSLFDGLSTGKKLFVITCNEVTELSEYLLNRPGRFHYHFEIKCPTADEIREYMTDKLGQGHEEIINKIVKFTALSDITYDCLRAIAFDISLGYTLEETLEDLNISANEEGYFDILVRLSNGMELRGFNNYINLNLHRLDYDELYCDGFRFSFYFKPDTLELKDGMLQCDSRYCRLEKEWTSNVTTEQSEEMEKKLKDASIVQAIFSKVDHGGVTKYTV